MSSRSHLPRHSNALTPTNPLHLAPKRPRKRIQSLIRSRCYTQRRRRLVPGAELPCAAPFTSAGGPSRAAGLRPDGCLTQFDLASPRSTNLFIFPLRVTISEAHRVVSSSNFSSLHLRFKTHRSRSPLPPSFPCHDLEVCVSFVRVIDLVYCVLRRLRLKPIVVSPA